MPRQIIPKKIPGGIAVSATPPQDDYTARLLKLIPADIIGVYLTISNLISTNGKTPDQNHGLQWAMLIVLVLVTPIYLWKIAQVKAKAEIAIAVVSFILWAICLGGPFEGIDIAGQSLKFLGALIMPVYTLLVPKIYQP